jgi:type I restriction enzyme M protein
LRAIAIVQDVVRAGFLNRFEITESLYSSVSEREIGEWLVPEEVADLMVQLAGDVSEKAVYCPYDNLCQFACRVHGLGGRAFVELSTRLAIFWLTNILTETPINAVVSEPIRSPGFTEKGKLKQFDVSIAFPPMGKKAERETVERDMFNRFPEKTFSWSILAIRHILAQTQGRAVVTVPNNVLFSSGAEKSLREDLLKNGLVKTVISFPPAILPSTAIQVSTLVLNADNKSDTVRFVDASSEEFFARDGRGRSRLVNVESLLETVYKGTDESVAVTVPVEEVLTNDACLEVSRYLRSPEKKRIEKILNRENTALLEDVVEFIRPPVRLRNEKEGMEVLEVMLNDFPEYGYLKKPERKVFLDKKKIKKGDYWLCPEDIIIAMKGSAGKVAIVPQDDSLSEGEKWVANQSCLVLRAKRHINPKVLFMYLRSEVGQNLLASMVSGATIPLIQLRSLKELPIILPSEEEADKIVITFNKIVELQSEIETLKEEQESLSHSFWNV